MRNWFLYFDVSGGSGASGHVIGLDIVKEFLAKGRSLASKSGLMERVSFKKGDVTSLPFDENFFDWACSIDLIGLLQIDPVSPDYILNIPGYYAFFTYSLFRGRVV